MISFDDFKKLDIRIGEVLSVEKIPDTDKLLKLMVDLGEESPRQIVSGIADYFEDYSEIAGKQIAILANLEPRVIKGYESQGMILATDLPAQEGNKKFFAFLVPSEKMKNGSVVR